MLSLRLLGNIFDLEILFGERSGTFRDYAVTMTWVSKGYIALCSEVRYIVSKSAWLFPKQNFKVKNVPQKA